MKDKTNDAVATPKYATVGIDPKEQKKKEQHPTIEEHAERLKLPAPVFAGVKEQNKWFSGKRVTKSEFEKAVNTFLKTPQGGK